MKLSLRIHELRYCFIYRGMRTVLNIFHCLYLFYNTGISDHFIYDDHNPLMNSVAESALFLPRNQLMFGDSSLGDDHMNVGCGGYALMLVKL